MNPILRTLEQWTTHQDYLWFLAVLAWGGMMAAEWPRRGAADAGSAPERGGAGWRIALALSFAVGAGIELLLLAQDLMQPYVRLDAAMGAAQAAGAAALAWGATQGAKGARGWRGAALFVIAALAVARVDRPVAAGLGLALAQALAVLALVRRRPAALPGLGALLLAVSPVIATHGPWAHMLGAGRRTNDWSGFALFAAGASLVAGAAFALSAWRRKLQQSVPGGEISGALRRDLRIALVALAVWLIGGVLLAVWYGRTARRAFEVNLLRRVETAVLAFDPKVVAEALSPELKITRVRRSRYPDGRPVDVATVPRTREPVYAALRETLVRLHETNPDLKFVYVQTLRDGQMLVLNAATRKPPDDIRHVIHHAVTATDLARIAEGKSFFEGPVFTDGWGVQFAAHAPLFHPVSKKWLGWVAADINATAWLTTFTQARLQTMTLVGAGVGLWALAVAYRLRRESRDAAERAAAAARAADRMKSDFLAKVSHELRTPIQSVLGYGEMLAGAPLGDTQRAWVAALCSHGGIMLRLVNDLIDLGALQSGAFRLEPGPVRLRELIHECAAALRPAADQKGIRFALEIDPNTPEGVMADEVRLRQVLLNLLNNAVKFTAAGCVTLQVSQPEADVIEFVVSDTGPGIPATARERLFQPFARLDPAAPGSGLGLALVRGLCTAMGGSVVLAEGTREGATFVVRLPLPTNAVPDRTGNATPALPSLAGLRVLVAEDNTLVRELLASFLKDNGATASLASDGVTALALARELKPDVLLLDVALPGLDGISVAEQLRSDRPAGLRIVGLSAHASRADELRAQAAGMEVFLAKPVRLAQLAEILGRTLPKRAAEPAFGARIENPALRARLAAQFAAETPRVLAELRAALASDWERARSRAHYLKNSADVLGETRLQDACHRLAVLEHSPGTGTAGRLVDAIEAAIPAGMAVSAKSTPADQG